MNTQHGKLFFPTTITKSKMYKKKFKTFSQKKKNFLTLENDFIFSIFSHESEIFSFPLVNSFSFYYFSFAHTRKYEKKRFLLYFPNPTWKFSLFFHSHFLTSHTGWKIATHLFSRMADLFQFPTHFQFEIIHFYKLEISK